MPDICTEGVAIGADQVAFGYLFQDSLFYICITPMSSNQFSNLDFFDSTYMVKLHYAGGKGVFTVYAGGGFQLLIYEFLKLSPPFSRISRVLFSCPCCHSCSKYNI